MQRTKTIRAPRANRCRALAAAALTVAAVAAASGSAHAADRVYWANFESQSIGYSTVDGTAGGTVPTTGATIDKAQGVALDSSSNRIFWANSQNGKISYASLSGSGGGDLDTTGASMSAPQGVAIDPTSERIYWANASSNKISYASLSGGNGGNLNTSGATVNTPVGVAVDPAAGKIYWANYTGGKISYARLDGTGGGDIPTTGAMTNGVTGVAVDAAAGRIYWTNNGGSIGSAKLDGSGGGQMFSAPGASINGPAGIALDTVIGRAYWANAGNDKISFGALSGTGGSNLLTQPGTTDNPTYLLVQKEPAGTKAPSISGSPKLGGTLTCGGDSWQRDVPAAFLYRAPSQIRYSWSLNGTTIGGATSTELKPVKPGDYRCMATAANAAGTASQSSGVARVAAPSNEFTVSKPVRNKTKGTATLKVTPAGPGSVTLAGRGLKPQQAKAGGPVDLPVKTTGRTRKRLRKDGSVRVIAKVAFTPTNGEQAVKQVQVKLVRK